MKTPYYMIEEQKLRQNLALISDVAHRTDTEWILAFKAFALWKTFPIFREYIHSTTASSLSEARLAFDGNTSTFWHTEWGSVEPRCPHTLVVDMAKEYKVTAFTYLSRQDGNQNGMVKAYEVYLSTDGKTWGNAVATGEFKNTTSLQVAKLKTPKVARYLKFVAKSEINGNAWTSAAEIGIQAEADVTAIQSTETSYVPRSQGYYDLHGRRVKHPTKGIYLSQGKKVIL